MQPGRAIGESLQAGVEEVRRRLDSHVAAMRQLDQRINELVARRGSALLDLAKHYLPTMDEKSIEGTSYEVRNDLLEVLGRKERRQDEIEKLLHRDREELERREAELAKVTEQLNEKVARRQELEKCVAERLHASDEFVALSRQAIEAEQQLENNERRVAEIKAEAAEKLPSYDSSRLFKYFYEQEYGSSAYRGSGIVKSVNRWVAQLIGFDQARRSYEFLKVTPELMSQEVARRREQFNVQMEKVEAIEDRVSDELGLTEVMRQGQSLGSLRDQIVAQAAQLQRALSESQDQLLKLERPDNEFYEQAVARLHAFLSNLRSRELQILRATLSKDRTTPLWRRSAGSTSNCRAPT